MAAMRLDDLIDGIRGQYPEQPLDQLTAAVLAGEHLRDLSDHLVGHFVDSARHGGASWSEIGGCLGVTKQGAQKRFNPRAEKNMFSRFTSTARQAIMQAQEEARAGRHSHVEPEHLLLGMLSVPDSLAMRALANRKIKPAKLRAVADQTLTTAGPGTQSPAVIPYSAAAASTLERAVGEAERLGHGYVGTEHVLLALLAGEASIDTLEQRLGITADETESFLAAVPKQV
jgi:hypothetical protein